MNTTNDHIAKCSVTFVEILERIPSFETACSRTRGVTRPFLSRSLPSESACSQIYERHIRVASEFRSGYSPSSSITIRASCRTVRTQHDLRCAHMTLKLPHVLLGGVGKLSSVHARTCFHAKHRTRQGVNADCTCLKTNVHGSTCMSRK